MSELKQNQHQIQQSGEHVQEGLLSQAELVAAILLKLFKRRERENSLRTEVKKGFERVEIAIDAQVAEQQPLEQKSAIKEQAEPLIVGNDSISINISSTEPKPSLNHFKNSVRRQNDLKALADRQTDRGREPERENPKETSSAKPSDLER